MMVRPEPAMTFIEIRDLDKSFGSFPALKNINLAIAEKEFVTFLGPSGCGKTTMLRTLAGFLAPDRGTIHVDGRLLSSPAGIVPPQQRRMGMVFQNYAVWPHMTVLENVAFGLRIAKVDRRQVQDRVARVLKAVGLTGLEQRHPGQLSGGQQQRVALARSLVVEPAILLLDEPLSNLDAKLRERMRAELKNLQRRMGLTFIYVTHDQAEAMALSDRIVVFDRGEVQQIGEPREIYEHPANLFVADFMGLINRLPATLVEQADGIARVRVGSQELSAAIAPQATGAAGAATVVIRPEAIRLAHGGAGENRLAGTIVDVTFLGNIIDYQVDIDGAMLRVQGDRQTALEPGARVALAVAVAECIVMRDEGADQVQTSIHAETAAGPSIASRRTQTS
jgi:ABC-type Fe3+/spermidine/putrescine transport system ATPase subunit